MDQSPLLTKSEHSAETLIQNEEHVVDIVGEDDSEQTPEEAERFQVCNLFTGDIFWDLIEFVVTLVQISAAIVVLILTKDEQPELHLNLWIISYICASIATLPILCWRFWQHSPRVGSETGINEAMDFLEKMLEYFFLGLIIIFLWCFLFLPSCLDDLTQHFWLWMALLTFSCIRYVLPNLERAASWFTFPASIMIDKTKEFFELIIKVIAAVFLCIGGILGCIAQCLGC